MSTLQASKVYLSADALFDLRLGTLVTISPEFAFELSKDATYFTRTSDVFAAPEFGELDKNIYENVLVSYKEDVLKNSIVTKIVPFMANLIVEILKQVDKISLSGPLELDINMHPFTISDEEASELLSLVIYRLGKIVSINVINLPPEAMTVEHVAETYLAMVMYRYHDWFNLHVEALKKQPLKNVGFYVPRINFISEFTEDQKKFFTKHGADPFEMMSKALAHFATMQFLPISTFCADLPVYDVKAEATKKQP